MDASRGYVDDRAGDVQSARYGRPSQASVPRYSRHGKGCVLGLDTRLRIARRESAQADALVILAGGRKHTRLLDSEARHRLASHRVWRLKKNAAGTGGGFDAERDFINVGSSSRSAASSAAAATTADWLGTHFMAAAQQEDGDDDVSTASEESDLQDTHDTLQVELRQLSQSLRHDATHVTQWLRLASLQGQALLINAKRERDSVRAQQHHVREKKAVAEAQISVLEKALDAHIDNRRNFQLLLARIYLADEYTLWDKTAIEAEWLRLIRLAQELRSTEGQSDFCALKTLTDMQFKYLEWKARTSHTLDELVHACEGAVELLRDIHSQVSDDGRQGIESCYLDVICLTTSQLRAAGYHERSMGILQALCEFTYNAPESITGETSQGFQEACIKFQMFWDSEEPRIGEENAQGFASFLRKMKSNRDAIRRRYLDRHNLTEGFSVNGTMPQGLSSPDPVKRFHSLDEARSRLRHFPARTSDHADWTTGELDVDADAFIFSDEVMKMILPLRSPDSLLKLFSLTADHFGVLVPNSDGGSHYSTARLSQHLWPEALTSPQQRHALKSINGQVMAQVANSRLEDPFVFPTKLVATFSSLYELFGQLPNRPKQNWFGHWDTDCIATDLVMPAIRFFDLCIECDVAPIRTVALMSRFGLSAVTERSKAVNKLARKLLAENKSNTYMWLAYAQYQRQLGEAATARQIYRSILIQPQSNKFCEGAVAQTWELWASLEWECGNFAFARNILLRGTKALFGGDPQVADDSFLQKPSLETFEVLRVRHFFQAQLLSISTCSPERARSLATCAALFEYLVVGEDDAFVCASSVFDATLSRLQDDDKAEGVAMAYLRLIWRHTSRDVPQTCRSRRYEPMHVRATLRTLSDRFPGSPAFLAIFASFEMSVKFENGLRRSLEEQVRVVLPNTTDLQCCTVNSKASKAAVPIFLEYIYVELHMRQDVVNTHAVRALLERAVSNESVKAHRIFWQIYLRFETLRCQSYHRDIEKAEQLGPSKARNHPPSLTAAKRALRDALARTKRLFYRALQCCPFEKDFYMYALCPPLRSAFRDDELSAIARALDERKLRTFASIDAFFAAQPPRRREHPSADTESDETGSTDDSSAKE